MKNESEIIIISKPNCMYCNMVKTLLNNHGYKYEVLTIDNNEIANELYKLFVKTHVSDIDKITYPSVIVDNHFIGGYEDVKNELKAIDEFKG